MIIPKIINLEIHLTNEVEDFLTENDELLIKEIKHQQMERYFIFMGQKN